MKTQNNFIYIITIITSLVFQNGYAQDVPFNCDYSAYLFQYNDVYALDLASGNSYQIATDVTQGNINATGYNPADGYIWGSLSSPEKSIVRIGQNFETTTFTIPELPNSNRYIGDVSAQGIYYLKGGGTTFYKIDLNPDSATYGEYVGQGVLSQNISIHDWAFNSVDGNIYAVEKNTNRLYRIDPTTGIVNNLGEVPIISGINHTYGAVYFDLSGRFYVSANQTGTIYVIQSVQNLTAGDTMQSNLFAYGPSSASNDGARCPTAPVPQEICGNGIDDDGDGLIDCDDPSCSGVLDCPIAGGASSGNEGGLESNNRLSQKINQRNFNRRKTGYTYKKENALTFEKTIEYATKNRNSDIDLENFIPLDVLDQTVAIESTPLDLIEITNASDIISVDYTRNDENIAALMILKTENGVYEHTKYICDRLLGAELLSVSTIELNGQNFIKSIIKNVEGNTEFVLSLSAKLTNQDANFVVESHWNLDSYEENTGFYNFQIWTNSLDDLIVLGSEVLNLLDTQRPIDGYNLTSPPTVFVKRGNYSNGMLHLDIVNTNNSQNITIDGGLRQTETSDTEYINIEKDITNEYISSHSLETGALFDIGFRIQNGTNDTPDDLYLSDGPWGVDDFALSTTIDYYEISPFESENSNYDLVIERNVSLEATTNEYVSVYRAFTPKYNSIDLSGYSMLEFDSHGTGQMQITLIKKSIVIWENQPKATVTLVENNEHFYVPLSSFTSNNNESLDLTDVTTIVFTMVSEDGTFQTKEMYISNIGFSNILGIPDKTNLRSNEVIVSPNPLTSNSTLNFYNELDTVLTLKVYNISGKQIYTELIPASYGRNSQKFNWIGLDSGIYIYKIESKNTTYSPGKLIIK